MHTKLIAAACVVVALATAAGIAYATIPDEKGVIHGCRNNGSGILRVIESGNCSSAETALDWVESAGHETFFSAPFQPPVEITAVAPAPYQHVLTLSLPAGGWLVSTTLEAEKASGNGILACGTFTAPDFVTSIERASMGTDPGAVSHLTLSGTAPADLPNAGPAELKCRQRAGATGPNPSIVLADITATQIGAITSGVGN